MKDAGYLSMPKDQREGYSREREITSGGEAGNLWGWCEYPECDLLERPQGGVPQAVRKEPMILAQGAENPRHHRV